MNTYTKKLKGTEGEKYGHPILDAVANIGRGKKTTKKAQQGYAKRRKNLIDKEVEKAK